MDFAKKILSKYGWKEGEGLGKNNTGIAAPLKASLKFDNAGLGVDRAQEFNDHWWERCFNEAASNVDVQVQQNGKITTGRKEGEDAVEISTKAFSARKLKNAKEQHASDGKSTYDNFLQTALLTQGGGEVENTERIRVEDIAVTKVSVLTDEELFKACGGRTAHKGARHGLKLSGKIARLEQQERELLEKMQSKLKAAEEQATAPKQKKRKDVSERESTEENLEPQEDNEDTSEVAAPSKSKKKKKDKAEKLKEKEEQTEDLPVKSKKKKNKAEKVFEEESTVNISDEEVKSKKKRKMQDTMEEAELPVKSKKKKKNKEAKEQ
ncbi:G patch domain-containing protein 4 [Drosophila kikkawai]|uniref:G patch domain-containing protein 4 n=1 Tax=Drosophila kikkawai TaxID=30033 RepID=A0A6P4JHZ6_DROKI|nr:G patch domain-containing protein 4 [Drosophila kikkawai]